MLHCSSKMHTKKKSYVGDFMQVKEHAMELAKAMEEENGVQGAVNAFYKHFPRQKLEPEPSPKPAHPKCPSIKSCFACH